MCVPNDNFKCEDKIAVIFNFGQRQYSWTFIVLKGREIEIN